MAEEFKTDLNEASIISSILNDAEGKDLLTAATQLKPEDFTDSRNRLIFTTVVEMSNKNIAPTYATLLSELENRKTIDEAGGEEYIAYLANDFSSLVPIENFIRNVKDKGLLNRFLNVIKGVIDDAENKSIKDIPTFIGESESKITKVTSQRRGSEVLTIGEVNDLLVERFVKQTDEFRKKGKRPGSVTGQETGYSVLDHYTKGWKKGNMIIIGARPSVGKTAFALNLAYNAAKKKAPVLFFSLEMGAEELGFRLLELTSSLSQDEINGLEYLAGSNKDQILVNTNGDSEQTAKYQKLIHGMRDLNSLPIYIDNTPSSNITDIINKSKKTQGLINSQYKTNLGLIIIDYLQLITTGNTRDGRQNEVADISRQVKQLARTLNVPVIALSQLSRDSQKNRSDKTPVMSDLRDSGQIEQDADMIFMLYRADYENHNDEEDEEKGKEDNAISQVKVSLIKSRNGRTGNMLFSFDKEHQKFTSIDNYDDNGVPLDDNL